MDVRKQSDQSPEQVRAAIAQALARDDRFRDRGIRVDAMAGSWGVRVRLQGPVPTWDARVAAERCAWGFPAVSGVDNAMIVAPTNAA
jgi:osmotically-inducible protein OsmY